MARFLLKAPIAREQPLPWRDKALFFLTACQQRQQNCQFGHLPNSNGGQSMKKMRRTKIQAEKGEMRKRQIVVVIPDKEGIPLKYHCHLSWYMHPTISGSSFVWISSQSEPPSHANVAQRTSPSSAVAARHRSWWFSACTKFVVTPGSRKWWWYRHPYRKSENVVILE